MGELLGWWVGQRPALPPLPSALSVLRSAHRRAGIAGAGRPRPAREQGSREPRELAGPPVDHDKLAFAGVGHS